MSSLPDNDDRTVIRPVTARTPTEAAAFIEADAGADDDTHALPQGTLLSEFELTKKIGEGGFSIVYLAQDQSLDRRVALKEYMPASIAARKGRTMVSARSERHQDTFEAGLKSFINEAKLLAQFDHRSLVKVYRFWEANGTAYMVMPFYEGVTLKDTVQAMSEPPDEAWLMAVLDPLTEALRVIHTEQCYHRDIAPDNVILLKEDQRPLLLDFGAARKVIGGMTQALTVILKPGYAPVEQYAELPDMKQGPWTDVYALAATVYWTITRKTPPPAVGRMLSDNYKPLAELAAGRYSDRFLQAIDRALVVRPEQRTQDISTFRRDIGLDSPSGQMPSQVPEANKKVVRPAQFEQTVANHAATTPSKPPKAGSRAGPALWLGGLGLAAALGGVAWWAVQDKPKAEPAPPAVPQVVAPAAPAPAPAPVIQTPSAVAPSPAIEVPPAPASAAEPPATEPTPPPVVTPPVEEAVPVTPAVKPLKKKNPVATPSAKANNSAECARVLQRISLGDSSPELMDRLKTLGCK
ncbi:MAG: serine/threonine protein kinase [Rubrivivax sp.]|nr:MAG: serine/threonine protein kinase [Rubrivivax sp.]